MKASEMSSYWGDQPYPADLWGRCPIRGLAVRIAQELLEDTPNLSEVTGDTATRLVEALIAAGVLPDELEAS